MTWRRRQGLLVNDLAEEVAVEDVRTGEAHLLAPTETIVWRHLAQPCGTEQLARATGMRLTRVEEAVERLAGAGLVEPLAA